MSESWFKGVMVRVVRVRNGSRSEGLWILLFFKCKKWVSLLLVPLLLLRADWVGEVAESKVDLLARLSFFSSTIRSRPEGGGERGAEEDEEGGRGEEGWK